MPSYRAMHMEGKGLRRGKEHHLTGTNVTPPTGLHNARGHARRVLTVSSAHVSVHPGRLNQPHLLQIRHTTRVASSHHQDPPRFPPSFTISRPVHRVRPYSSTKSHFFALRDSRNRVYASLELRSPIQLFPRAASSLSSCEPPNFTPALIPGRSCPTCLSGL